MNPVIYATTNPGKFVEVSKLFRESGLELHRPFEYGVTLDVAETGSTLEENAILKAESYRNSLPSGCVVLGDDTGVEIAALGGEPGIKVRRWKGYKMTDEEIIEYCLERMKKVPVGERQAQFRTVIAVAMRGRDTKIFDGTLDGEIVTEPVPQRHEGFPFESLLYLPQWQVIIADIYDLPAAKRTQFQTHRHLALRSSLPYVRRLAAES